MIYYLLKYLFKNKKQHNYDYDFRRETPNDVVVIKNESPNSKTWEEIIQTEGSVIGTSSVRR